MADRPLRVCLVSPVPPPYGGIGHWTQMVLRHSEKHGDLEMSVINTAPRWRAVHDLAKWKRVTGGGLQLLRDVARFISLMIRRKPDVVHLTTSGQLAVVRDIWILRIARLFKVPAVYHIRFGRVPEIAGEGTWEWRMMRRAMAMAHTVIPLDSATEDAIRKYAPKVRVLRIPNCIDPSELPAPREPTGEGTAMYLGWVIPTKGVGELVEAWTRLKPKGWRLMVAGPGDAAYKEELLKTHRPERLEFTGELGHEEAMKLLAGADLFVLPSYTEGFPNVILEAMVLGRPIVATTVGAIPEMISDGCGILISPKNVEELTDALSRALSDGALRAGLGVCARARALEEFSIEAVFARYKALWKSCSAKSN
ncbi:glycosyltransferase family 1 protein [bacterium]|nr:MAG: glycosyltransferase family 1 protein [bacterium]